MTLKQKEKLKSTNEKNGFTFKKAALRRHLPLLNKLIFGLIVCGGVYFVFSINDLSVKGFILEDLKAEASALSNDNSAIELAIMELESLENVRTRAAGMDMVKVDHIEYLTTDITSVAKK